MRKILSVFLVFFCLLPSVYALENHPQGANLVDVTVSPTRYELDGEKGQSTTKSIKVFNNSQFPVGFTSSIENCRPKDTSGTPDCSVNRDFDNPNTHIAGWISLSESGFTIPANSEKDVSFTVKVPSDATPGSHFGAVFFSTGKKGGGMITTEKRIGVLVLYTVAGKTVTDGKVEDVVISVSGNGAPISGDSGGWGNAKGKISASILASLKQTVFNTETEVVSGAKEIILPIISSGSGARDLSTPKENLNQDVTKISFSVNFVNSGNTHIKPQGKIVILDEGKPIPRISREEIKNGNDAIIGEKIVDYIPINDDGGNTLPNSKRTFDQDWTGFPYDIINEKGETEKKYRNFSEYYTNKNLSDRQILMPWEQIKTRTNTKKLTAKIEVGYDGNNGKKEEFNSAKDFDVAYKEQYVGYNWFVLLILGIFGILVAWWIIAGFKRRKREDNEMKKLKKKLKEQEKEIDKIEDMVEDLPAKIREKTTRSRRSK